LKSNTVTIGCFHDHLPRVEREATIVAVDVLRATTTAITAVESGSRVLVAESLEAAVPLAARLPDPLLVGELGGFKPYGFDLQNSPHAVAGDVDRRRPMILLSTSGTRLMAEAAEHGEAFAASLRNVSAQARALSGRGRVRLFGADSRGEFRPEDQLCCARIAVALLERGLEPGDRATERVLERWGDAADDSFLTSPSVQYLQETGQKHDVDFVLERIDDLDVVYPIVGGEVRRLP